jgi:serine/threonine-protein kinase
MGEVYEAVDDVLGREVAIKALKTAKGALLVDDRFRLEARAIAKLSHPGVVQVFDLDTAADPPFIVMERVAGPSLAERLKAGPLPASEIVPLGIQIARALAAAHAADIVHRDVKPANILAAGAGTWKLADFGVAHVPSSSLTITGQFVGSPAYAPPEALVKGVVAPAGDVYGLGATLYEAAAGRWPRVEAKAALLAPVPPLHELAPQLPFGVAAAIDRAVAFEAAQRPSAAEFAELLAHPGDSQPIAVHASGPMPRAATPVPAAAHLRWKPWAIAGAVVLLVIVLASRGGGGSGSSNGDIAAPQPVTAPADDPELQEHAARDSRRIADEANRGHYRKARELLDEFDRRYGETEWARQLRDQLPDEDAPPPPGPPGRGRHGKHGE